MYISKIRKLTEVEVENLEPYKVNSKFINFDYENALVIKTFGSKTKWSVVFKCCCGSYFCIDNGKLGYALSNGNLDKINCGCIYKNAKKIKIKKAKAMYFKKEQQSNKNPEWCTYCESYRPEVKQKSKNTHNCSNCDFLISNAVVLGETFEDIMERWNPATHKPCTKKLPYLEGNNKKGYKVRGFTYISSDWYDEASKWLWIKVKDYIKTSFSKDNLSRIGKLHLYKTSKERKYRDIFLHRFILGLGNDVTMVGDHLSGYKLDNRSINLRYITVYQNSLNSKKINKTTSSLYKGVCKLRTEQRNKKWKSSLTLKTGKCIQRYHITEIDAAKCYDDMLRKYLPDEVHRFNFPNEGELSAI